MFPSDSDHETKVTLETERGGVIDEPPFRLLVLGDWSADAEKSGLDRRGPLEIDRDNFDDIMKKLRVRLELESDGDGLTLEFQGLDDFHPDELFKQVPMFADLRDLRRRLNNESTFNSAAREVRQWASDDRPNDAEPAEAEKSAVQPADNLLDAILSVPSGGAPPPRTKASAELSSFIGDIVRPHLVSVDENEQAGLVAAVDRATGDLMRVILHNKRFQQLEAAWRGLFFLVRRTDTSSDLKIYILNATQAEISEDLKNAGSLAETVLYKHLVKDVQSSGGEPWAAVFANYAYEPVVDDIAALIRIAKIAAPANSPFVSHMRPEILGISSLAEHPDPAEWDLSAETPAGKLWAALRSQSEVQHLGLTIPRFIARLPYGADTDPLETFEFEEFTESPAHDDYLWANSAFAVALLLAQSYSENGWDLSRSLVQDIDGLPIHMYEENGETIFKSCAEVQISQNAGERLMEYGLMPLVSFKNTDRMRLTRFQSITDPVRVLKGRWS